MGILRLTLVAAAGLVLAGCGDMRLFAPRDRAPDVGVSVPAADTLRPEARPAAGGLRPPAGARTAAAFDTTTAAERVAAVAPPAAPARELGRTIAALGNPAESGFWLSTGLVDTARDGRVTHAPSGASVRVELRPSGRAPGSGSQLSLPAFRALNLPLTDLPELIVLSE